jgi:hypothetical protein
VTDNGIRERIPQTRDDQDDAEPEGAEPEAYISHQTHEYAGNVEEGDGNDAPGTIGRQLRKMNTVFRLGLVNCGCFLFCHHVIDRSDG